MKFRSQTTIGRVVLALLTCLAGNQLRGQAFVTNSFACLAEGTWNAKGVHTSTNGSYMIGYNYENPVEQAAYFVFDLTSIQGETVTNCWITIPGSIDYHITDYFPTPDDGLTNNIQFKVGIAPQSSDTNITVGEIMTGNNNYNVYHYSVDPNQNQDLGYRWVVDGLHLGFTFGAFTYNPPRLQTEVNAGGQWAFWACDRFDAASVGENYLWGSTFFTTNIVLTIVTVK
jgi:hypothetical protein